MVPTGLADNLQAIHRETFSIRHCFGQDLHHSQLPLSGMMVSFLPTYTLLQSAAVPHQGINPHHKKKQIASDI
jgi:hypothetical protein